MIVTDKNYYMDNTYLSKLDLMIKRMRGTDDNLLLVDGDEGQGKTEFAVGTCYYISYEMKRPYNPNHIFFNLDEAMHFVSETKEQIIHLDEGALGLMSSQWWNKNQQKFLQLVMVARKKKHFMVICIPKFYKLNQYIVEERSIGLVHVYSRKNLVKGRFCYYTKNGKERLYQEWKKKKYKNYRKYYSFHGSFVKAMKKVFTKEEIDEYERKKDIAIMGIVGGLGEDKKITKKDIQIETLLKMRKNLPEMSISELADGFGVSKSTINRWISINKEKSLKN